MKSNNALFLAVTVMSLTFAAVSESQAQATVQTTTTSTQSLGTVSEFGPDTIVVRSETAPEPLRYTYSKTTTYVDETGAPVSMETIKSGLPVTVYYTQVGDRLVASRVMVRRATAVVPVAPAVPVTPTVVEKRTTTTTTTTEKKND